MSTNWSRFGRFGLCLVGTIFTILSKVSSRLLGLTPAATSNQPRTVAYAYMSRSAIIIDIVVVALHNSLVCIEFWHKFLSLVLPNLCCLFYFSSIYLNLKMFTFSFLLLILSCLFILCLLIFFVKYIWFIINFGLNLAALRIFANLRI